MKRLRDQRGVAMLLELLLVAVVLALVGLAVLAAPHAKNTAGKAAATPAPSASPSAAASANVWSGSVNPAALPLGDGKVSSAPRAGYVYSCTTSFRGGGARHAGSWLNSAAGTWDSTAKVAVQGSVTWPAASYSEATTGSGRALTTNDLPETYPTGNYPIRRNDPAYAYDTNPNAIGAQSIMYTLPLNPVAAASPACVGLGPIGVLSDGVVFYNSLDDAGRDAVAHETQDRCDGHPDGHERYHYHNVPSCIRDRAAGASTLVGYALDGYGIYVERDAKGNLPTNADLDACHGRTSQVMWNGRLTSVYHYDATLEYPYTVGCYHGTPVSTH